VNLSVYGVEPDNRSWSRYERWLTLGASDFQASFDGRAKLGKL
jgi:hypothetical protein